MAETAGAYRVLIVDDDFMVGRLHGGVIARMPGFEVVGSARTGAEAISLARKENPDLLLLDVYLPDMTGIEVLRKLRRDRGVGPDVLMLSAAKDIETVRMAQQAGVFHYLIKPFDIEALRLRLSEYAVFRSQVDAVTEAHQDDVDRLFRPGQVRLGKEPPKGISTETIELVVRALREATDDISAQECAEVVGLSRSSARRYLEHLVDAGRAHVRHRYGATGRPERRFSAQ